jgi:hypothetical protein
MRDLIKLLEQVAEDGSKITTAAFLYLEPKTESDEEDFAQCGSCGMFMPGKQRCWLFGADDKVVANASCGLYIHGEPSDDQEPENKVTPEEAGYNLGQVRCENCRWFTGSACDLFKMLNEKLPTVFDLEISVKEYGCCNAWQK